MLRTAERVKSKQPLLEKEYQDCVEYIDSLLELPEGTKLPRRGPVDHKLLKSLSDRLAQYHDVMGIQQ